MLHNLEPDQSILFALNTGITKNNGNNNKSQLNTPSIRKGPVKGVEIAESTPHKWFNLP